MSLGRGSHLWTVTLIGGAAIPVAIARYVMKGWVEPHGIPPVVGSLLASVTVLLLAGMLLIFSQEARSPDGRYPVAARWFTLLAAWCEAVIVVSILLSGRFGADTYYQGPWDSVRHAFPTPERHALASCRRVLAKATPRSCAGRRIAFWTAGGVHSRLRKNRDEGHTVPA